MACDANARVSFCHPHLAAQNVSRKTNPLVSSITILNQLLLSAGGLVPILLQLCSRGGISRALHAQGHHSQASFAPDTRPSCRQLTAVNPSWVVYSPNLARRRRCLSPLHTRDRRPKTTLNQTQAVEIFTHPLSPAKTMYYSKIPRVKII